MNLKILLISDTHGHTDKLGILLEQYDGTVDMICHLGNSYKDIQKFSPGIPTHFVHGNGDGGFDVPGEKIINFGKAKILLVHGHNHSVYDGMTRLYYYALRAGVDAAFVGHTHVPHVSQESNIFIMNPGSLTQPRSGSKASYGIVTYSPTHGFSGEVLHI